MARNELYAAPFNKLNDPFEAVAIIDNKSFEVGKLVLGWLKGRDHVQTAETELTKALDEFVSFTRGIGVYSLSKTATDELLWAHYANSHQGFCLEFDLDELLEHKLSGEEVLNVDYLPEPPVVSILGFLALGQKKELIKKLVATKSQRWKYEDEIRICVGSAGLREYDFRALKAVYFGVRCSDRLVRLTMRLLRGRNLRYYQMTMLDGTYSIQPVEISDRYASGPTYRARIAPVEDGVPYLDDKTRPFEREILAAIEMTRRDPYCERVTDAYISGTKGTSENPVFYVTYERSDGLPRNMFFSRKEIRANKLYSSPILQNGIDSAP